MKISMKGAAMALLFSSVAQALTIPETLDLLYSATNGHSWSKNSGWSDDYEYNYCEWPGITCYNVDRYNEMYRQIETIDLSDNHLDGTIPSEIFRIPFLSNLILRENPDLTIHFKGMEHAHTLNKLVISNTNIESFEGLQGNELRELHLTDCSLDMPFPKEITGLQKLNALYANYNHFYGELPSELGEMTSLVELYLLKNKLEGPIPESIGNLSDLEILVMSDNQFTGTLSSDVFNRLAELRVLSLEKNKLQGQIPSLHKLYHIRDVFFNDNQFTGSVPENFLWHAPKDELMTVEMRNNQLSGNFYAKRMADFSNMNLDITMNEFTSIDADLCQKSEWMGGAVGALKCDAIMCPIGSWAPAGRSTSEYKCQNGCETARFMGSNNCDGDKKRILREFYLALNGDLWNENNWFKTDDECEWTGVTCSDDGLNLILGLDLRGMKMLGTVPSSVFKLEGLKEMDFSDNFVRFSFTGIRHAKYLRKLDLTSTGLDSFKDFEELRATSILELFLSSNNLNEEIPQALYDLTDLRKLMLAHNNLYGGISSQIGRLSNLEEFNVYGNNLSGQIPKEFGALRNSLKHATFSENDFTGTIPEAFSDMPQLITLGMHQKTNTQGGFTGPVPEFSGCPKLEAVSLAGNSLSGNLPSSFMENSERLGKEIDVDLSSNKITGQIPSSWDMFGYLNFDLSDNMIDHIHSSLCTMKGWQGGILGEMDGCDAILCKKGTFNANGMASPGNKCVPCAGAQFYGTTKCDELGSDEIWWILETFYASTNGDDWDDGHGWLHSANPCDGKWEGITCDNDNVNIIEIDLSHKGLSGTPDTIIFNLPRLQKLDLSHNNINFSFHGIGAAKDLRILKLSETRLSSLEGIGAALSLNQLHITGNYLEGHIPDELYDLVNLRGLYMNYNRFTGRLSSKIGQLQNLQELYMMKNAITGPIPSAIGNLKEMQVLSLSENFLVGSIPESLNNMKNLKVLAIQGEAIVRLNGRRTAERTQIAAGLSGALPSFDGLENLEGLYLAYNSLNGKIPYNFLAGIKDKSKPIAVDLGSNFLAGVVPASLTQFDMLDLALGNNKFNGVAPGLCKMNEWFEGDIGEYACDGLLCPQHTYNELGRRHHDMACIPCPENTVAPYLGSTKCESAEEQAKDTERLVLKTLYDSVDGIGWHTQNNWYDDTMSFCDWYGIKCTDDGNSIQGIYLDGNGLKGTIPDVVFDLPNLMELNLADNEVVINFDYIGSTHQLQYLNIENTGMTSLTGLESAKRLKVLHANNNALTKFPEEILSLSNLQVLYLSDNKFGSSIPNLSGLSNLAFFACKRCDLSGSLPSWWGTLSKLQYLSLSGNKLSGAIPASFENLLALTHLDLSDQAPRGGGFTGSIPSFSNAASLNELYLQKNKLSGALSEDFFALNTARVVVVDLRWNSISGSVPRSLINLNSDFSLLLAGNQIGEIPPEICDSPPENWNQGDLATFGCDGLLCKKGTYSPIGRATSGYQCKSCGITNDASEKFFGSTKCGEKTVVKTLESLYYSLGGPDWFNNDGWTENDEYCAWYGLECDSNKEVIGIDLGENNLIGSIPKDIFSLTNLKSLNFRKNSISSVNFSGVEKVTGLTSLNLSSTGLTSLSGIGAAQSLKELHFTSNGLTSIPNELFNLSSLERLLLNYNKISGKISPKFGQLSALKELYLFRNNLGGALPSEIANLKNIEVLGLGENDFAGEIPSGINDLQNLKVLALQHVDSLNAGKSVSKTAKRGFTGTLPSFDNNPNLRELYLQSNSLTGRIPNSFLRSVEKNDNLIVDLSNNMITEGVPKSLGQFSKLDIILVGNQISSIADDLCENGDWMNGRVASTGCDAILCPVGFYNEFGRQSNDDTPCKPCPFTFTAPFYGSISCDPDSTDYNEREILTKLYRATGGSKWIEADNWLEDKTSICDWHGIFCESMDSEGGNRVVTEIHLPSNRLTGTVPPQVFNLVHLKMFNVRDNDVDVELYAMRESPALRELYLDHTNLSSLKGIGRATNLKTLHVQQNNLRGEFIPEELFTIGGLEHLFISDANLSGPLSDKIGNLQELKEFYCHGNDLSGEIPETIGDLINLEVLILSENLFMGPLPDSIKKLKKLESLFIDSFTRKSAGLSGPLPSFEGMPNLRQLYLNENSLTGPIPDDFLSNDKLIEIDSVSTEALAALARRKQKVNVGLRGNRIEGSIPVSLTKFQRLNIDLADNLITYIDNELCQMDNWMGSDVGTYECDAILCPAGYFNRYGRQTNPLHPCEKCEGAERSDFLGATKCLSEIKKREREILVTFYNECGGSRWKNNEGWLEDSIDICNWHGVSCSNGGSVDTIDLGSNNVVGTPPKELFELENLTYLWLYSNPLKFSFEGIGQAKQLESLLLDSTGLDSLKGIGRAYNLVDLDIRFNNMKGKVPDEFSNLVNLESISMSDNSFTGELPSFSRMHRLKSLRAASNHFVGELPSFEDNYRLKTIDLSDNKLSGSISPTFLESVDTSETLYVDLSRNRIGGKVPGELARFEKMTFFLKDNYIYGIDRDVCDNEKWNDGDVGQYSCDAILCPPGTFATGKGRQSFGGSECSPCKDAKFYGQSQCIDLQDFYSSATTTQLSVLITVAVVGVSLFLM